MQNQVSKVAPENHQKETDAETLGEASEDASRDDTEDDDVARQVLSTRPGKNQLWYYCKNQNHPYN